MNAMLLPAAFALLLATNTQAGEIGPLVETVPDPSGLAKLSEKSRIARDLMDAQTITGSSINRKSGLLLNVLQDFAIEANLSLQDYLMERKLAGWAEEIYKNHAGSAEKVLIFSVFEYLVQSEAGSYHHLVGPRFMAMAGSYDELAKRLSAAECPTVACFKSGEPKWMQRYREPATTPGRFATFLQRREYVFHVTPDGRVLEPQIVVSKDQFPDFSRATERRLEAIGKVLSERANSGTQKGITIGVRPDLDVERRIDQTLRELREFRESRPLPPPERREPQLERLEPPPKKPDQLSPSLPSPSIQGPS